MRLDDWPLPYLRISCTRCGREGKLNTDKLVEKFGPDEGLFMVREQLAEPGCKREDKSTPCMAILPDALLVDAIIEEDESKVIKPELIPEAKEWRKKLGME
jgi:hypothetical protein